MLQSDFGATSHLRGHHECQTQCCVSLLDTLRLSLVGSADSTKFSLGRFLRMHICIGLTKMHNSWALPKTYLSWVTIQHWENLSLCQFPFTCVCYRKLCRREQRSITTFSALELCNCRSELDPWRCKFYSLNWTLLLCLIYTCYQIGIGKTLAQIVEVPHATLSELSNLQTRILITCGLQLSFLARYVVLRVA